MERDPSREKIQWLTPPSQIVSYLQVSENKVLSAGCFPSVSSLPGGNLGTDTDSSPHFRKTVITIQYATKTLSMTSVARAQAVPPVGVNPIGI